MRRVGIVVAGLVLVLFLVASVVDALTRARARFELVSFRNDLGATVFVGWCRHHDCKSYFERLELGAGATEPMRLLRGRKRARFLVDTDTGQVLGCLELPVDRKAATVSLSDLRRC